MPMYEYECPTHGRFTRGGEPADVVVCKVEMGKLYPSVFDPNQNAEPKPWYCNSASKRKWGFQMPRVMQETFSPATGTVVTSKRQLAEQLKIKSEEADRRSLEGSLAFKRAADEQGIDIGDFQPREIHHNFVPTEDPAQIGLTDEVKEQAKEHATNTGRRDPKLYG